MKKISILIALIFVLASCWEVIEKKVVEKSTAVVDTKSTEWINAAASVTDDIMEKTEEVVVDVMETKEWEWTYQDYSEAAVKASSWTNVLFFHASWCPTCVASDKNLQAETIPEGLNIFKIDFDDSTELRQKYGVTTKHTFVSIDENLEKIEMVVGWLNDANDIKDAFMKEDVSVQEVKVLNTEEKVMIKEDTSVEEDTDIMVKEESEIMEKETDVMVKEENEVIIKDEEADAMVKDDLMKIVEGIMEEDNTEAEVTLAAWTYQDYSETAVKASTGSNVLFFHATWCPSCNAADKNIKAEAIPAGLNIFKVDYDSNVELRKKYGVTAQHTFVLIDENLEKVKLMAAWRNSSDIVNWLLN